MATTLISPTTDAATVENISVRKHSVPMTIIASGLGADETIDVQIETASETYVDVYQSGTQVQLSETNNTVTIYGPGKYAIVKAATAAAVGVYMVSDIHYD